LFDHPLSDFGLQMMLHDGHSVRALNPTYEKLFPAVVLYVHGCAGDPHEGANQSNDVREEVQKNR
jgi:hypothetical protein